VLLYVGVCDAPAHAQGLVPSSRDQQALRCSNMF
jgi:hypothetical protein